MKTLMTFSVLISLVLAISFSCKNREIIPNEEYAFREIHESMQFHFDTIKDGKSQYLILEKDRNHPHEGFGFMALKGDMLHAQNDSILAYLRALVYTNALIMSKLNNSNPEHEIERIEGLVKANLIK